MSKFLNITIRDHFLNKKLKTANSYELLNKAEDDYMNPNDIYLTVYQHLFLSKARALMRGKKILSFRDIPKRYLYLLDT